ncbi:hypothetical protein A1O3_00854 [Capronia epimyces CBS 606.96]|uniref:DhaK domain-containing protein n=1 Tax=Capronia epimyces CBS 606.96 TaxID=1182542 RepID=W9ZCQ0_9EURO|nr:uncharacterized protein A1O3_00854 [Capronia epimyces CBS 606.96]EXJ92304.1 hypothetical protein A1O3_00854 [Capronia epimyces CBS 606.96]
MAASVETGSSMMGLPAALDIRVEDIVAFDLNTKTGETTNPGATAEASAGTGTGAGLILVAKTCDALTKMGYEDADVRKVGILVERNLMTALSTQLAKVPNEDEPETINEDEVAGEVGLMLQGLLDKNIPRSRNVQVNSNEPVVFINRSDTYDRTVFAHVVDETVRLLQQKWNIWPVRVYGGPCVKASTDGFSITLLNVVNTDIGGPSMVQLLDAACGAPEWCSFTRTEAWRERDLLYREERDVPWREDESVWDDISERSSQSDGDASLDSQPLSLVSSSSPEPTEPDHEQQPGGDDAGASLTPEVISKYESAAPPAQETTPADSETGEPSWAHQYQSPERHVEHPTWDRHDDSVSLLDLIKSQVSRLAPSDKHEDASDERQGEAVDQTSQAQDNPATEDEFVVV